MNDRQREIIRIYGPYLAMVLTLALVLAIGWSVWTMRTDVWERDRQVAELLMQVQDLQAEKHQIENDIQNHLGNPGMKSNGWLCLTVQAGSAWELRQMEQSLDGLEIPLTLVLDVELPWQTRQELLDEVALHPSWQVIFTGSQDGWVEWADELVAEIPQAVKFAYLGEFGRPVGTMEALGWLGYSLAVEGDGEFQTEVDLEGLSMVGHIMLQGTNSLDTAVQKAVEQRTGFLLSVDMADLGKTFTSSTVKRVVNRLDADYFSQGTMEAVTISEFFAGLQEAETAREEAVQMTQEYVAQQEKRLESIQARIDELYAQAEALEQGK